MVYKNLDNGAGAATKVLTQQSQEIVIPSYSAWFDMSSIGDVERKALPEFFNGKNKSKTPGVYKDYRDFMINTYRLNPSEYLTVTACRRNLAGDVCAIVRVHAVLEQWGLINYQVDPDTRPSAVGPAFTGHFRVTADTPRGLEPLFPSISHKRVAASSSTSSATETEIPSAPLAVQSSLYDPEGSFKRPLVVSADKDSKKQRIMCSTCGVDCASHYLHCTKSAAVNVCGNCYAEGRFPSTLFSGDFVKLSQETTGDSWTSQETLLLLEGIELFDDDWSRIASHVGSRSREQCVLHFLRLPIEDSIATSTTTTTTTTTSTTSTTTSSVVNPVLSLTSFLATIVDPQVAAAAAETAVKSIKDNASGSAMDVDGAGAAVIGAAAAKAHSLATNDEQEMQRLTRVMIETQLRKLELKLQHFHELEASLEHERKAIERDRQKLYLDRLEMRRLLFHTKELVKDDATLDDFGGVSLQLKSSEAVNRNDAVMLSI